jgi:hypothetical protein
MRVNPKPVVRRRKASTLSKLGKRLEQLRHAFAVASEVTQAKLIVVQTGERESYQD